MKALIDRDDAIKEVHKTMYEFFDLVDDDDESPITYKDKQLLEINKKITQRITALPTADVAERKKGKWVVIMDEPTITFDECKCSECGVVEYFNKGWKKFNYCPNCGADMKKETDMYYPQVDGITPTVIGEETEDAEQL